MDDGRAGDVICACDVEVGVGSKLDSDRARDLREGTGDEVTELFGVVFKGRSGEGWEEERSGDRRSTGGDDCSEAFSE